MRIARLPEMRRFVSDDGRRFHDGAGRRGDKVLRASFLTTALPEPVQVLGGVRTISSVDDPAPLHLGPNPPPSDRYSGGPGNGRSLYVYGAQEDGAEVPCNASGWMSRFDASRFPNFGESMKKHARAAERYIDAHGGGVQSLASVILHGCACVSGIALCGPTFWQTSDFFWPRSIRL